MDWTHLIEVHCCARDSVFMLELFHCSYPFIDSPSCKQGGQFLPLFFKVVDLKDVRIFYLILTSHITESKFD